MSCLSGDACSPSPVGLSVVTLHLGWAMVADVTDSPLDFDPPLWLAAPLWVACPPGWLDPGSKLVCTTTLLAGSGCQGPLDATLVWLDVCMVVAGRTGGGDG